MKLIEVFNSNGNRSGVMAKEESMTLTPMEKGVNVHCLTCGYIPEKPNNLEIVLVSTKEGLQPRLHNQNFKVKTMDFVLLCKECNDSVN